MNGPCLNTLLLRIIYYSNIIIKILRFLIPILLIIKLVMDISKKIIDPEDDKFKKNIVKRLILAFIIFIIPTFVSLFLSLSYKLFNIDINSNLRLCTEFANLEYINMIEEEYTSKETELYLNNQTKYKSNYLKYAEAIRNMVKAKQVLNGVGSNANNSNMIKCGSGSSYNTGLFNAVRSAGYKTREGVVAAALYLSSYIDVHIPYFWSGGHLHSYNGYQDKGDNFIGVPNKWGCNVKMQFGGTSLQKNGTNYPFGIDCSGFVNWAIMNGGYYTGSSSQRAVIATKTSVPTGLEGIKLTSVTVAKARGKIKPGDILLDLVMLEW